LTDGQKQDYEIAFTHLTNNQNISAYNQFINLAQAQKKSNKIRAAILYLLAAECKTRQGKDNSNEILEAGKLFLEYGKKENSYNSKGGYLCASRCFLKAGQYDEAKKLFNKAKEIPIPQIQITRPVVIIEDSEAMVLKIKSYLEKLGYKNPQSFQTGTDGIKGCKKLISESKNPIVLLDMGLPDIDGDVVASKLLAERTDLQIVLITADEKTSKRAHKAISNGVTAFIQKPFTIEELKSALDLAEKDFVISQQ